jgi:hypothetical protein
LSTDGWADHHEVVTGIEQSSRARQARYSGADDHDSVPLRHQTSSNVDRQLTSW